MSGQFDLKSAAALAERLENPANGYIQSEDVNGKIWRSYSMADDDVVAIIAALRQRPQESLKDAFDQADFAHGAVLVGCPSKPGKGWTWPPFVSTREGVEQIVKAWQRPQEERPAFFDCVQCGVSKTVKDQGDDLVCATCWREFQQAKPQAPEERPDLIALLEAELPEWKGELYDRGFAEGFGRAIGRLKELSALRAQPAPAERTALERTWQPIETAPHVIGAEGCILAWWPESYTVSTVAWWDGKKWISDHVESEIGQPTHWMPLQAGPQARQEQE